MIKIKKLIIKIYNSNNTKNKQIIKIKKLNNEQILYKKFKIK